MIVVVPFAAGHGEPFSGQMSEPEDVHKFVEVMKTHNVDVTLYFIDPKLGDPNKGDAERISKYPKNVVIVPGKIEDFLSINRKKLANAKLVVYVQPFEPIFFMCDNHYGRDVADYNDPKYLFLKIRGTGKHFDPNVILKYYPGPGGMFIREFTNKNPFIPETNYYELLAYYVFMEKHIKTNPSQALPLLRSYLPNTNADQLLKDFNNLMKPIFAKFTPWSKSYFDNL